MDVTINRLDPHVPDPVESRRRTAGRMVRIAYATVVFGILAFFVVYFASPLVFLSGPGIVSSARQVVSAPYTVQIVRMYVTPGVAIKKGDEIGHVLSPEHDGIVANYLRTLADLAGRRAELRVKARVSQESLEPARAYLRLTEEAVGRVEAMSSASLNYRVEVFRERAAASKAVVSQEAEVAESIVQLADLDKMSQEVQSHLDEVRRNFAGGAVVAPIDGLISINLGRVGQSLVAGTAIAEILDTSDIFVDWYIPNERMVNPTFGQEVIVLFGNRRISGRVVEILPVSDIYRGAQQRFGSSNPSTQIGRIRFTPGVRLPPLNATVSVRMFYTGVVARSVDWLVNLFGLD
jgi:multidrug resistance efflux pump